MSQKPKPKRTLGVHRCPTHGFFAICVNDEHGGERVTPSKCCGRWDTEREWALTAIQWRDLARLANEAAEFMAGGRS